MNNLFELITTCMIRYNNKWIIEVSSCCEKIFDGNWRQGAIEELNILISDSQKDNA